ncbi:MAG: DnaD domain protein [Clostridia bacterium]
MVNCMYSKAAVLRGKTAVDNVFVLEYMQKLPESCLRVYLFGLMQSQFPQLSREDITIALKLDGEALTKAFSYLRELGLVSIISDSPLTVEFLPITAIPSFSETKTRYDGLLNELQSVLKTRVFTATELSLLYDWIEIFGISEKAVVSLVKMCIETNGSRVSIKYMDKVARTWADEGIFTENDAKEFANNYMCEFKGAKELKKRWRVPGNITEDELSLYRKWRKEWGFSDEAIINACSEVANATRPSFGYLDKVLRSFFDNGKVDVDALIEFKNDRSKTFELARIMFLRAGLKSSPRREQCDEIDSWLEKYHIDSEILLFAAECSNGKRSPFGFMRSLIKAWGDKDIHNLDDAKRDFELYSKNAASSKPTLTLNYSMRKYTEEELNSLMSFGDDLNDPQ